MANRGIGNSSDVRKKMAVDYELITTAIHESGHTITALLHKCIVSSVEVSITSDKRKKRDPGCTYFESALEIETTSEESLLQTLILSEIKINYAGLAAEKIFYKDMCGTDKLPMVLKYGSYQDREKVSDLIKKYNLAPPGKKRHLYKKKMFRATQAELTKFWSDVKLISHMLYEKKKLYYTDLRSLLQRRSPNKKFWRSHFKCIDSLFEAAYALDIKTVNNIIINQ